MLNSLPIWLSQNIDNIVAVEKYEQDLLSGFLIINFDKETYEGFELPNPLSVEEDFDDDNKVVNEYYIFDKDKFFNSVENIKSSLTRLNEEDKLKEIGVKYNVHPISLKPA